MFPATLTPEPVRGRVQHPSLENILPPFLLQNLSGIMKVLVTGAAGFLGQKLATALLNDDSITEIKLTDIILPRIPVSPTSKKVAAMRSNLTGAGDREKLISQDLDVIFVLHGIMSGRAETHFESGMSVNFDSTRGLLDLARKV